MSIFEFQLLLNKEIISLEIVNVHFIATDQPICNEHIFASVFNLVNTFIEQILFLQSKQTF